MSYKGFRWGTFIVTAVLSALLLFSGRYFYERLGLVRPLESALASNPAVADFTIKRQEGITYLDVLFEGSYDLKGAYDDLRFLASETLGQGSFEISVSDKRDEDLKDAYYAIHYCIQEAAQNGNFSAMIDLCENILDRKDLGSHKIVVDKDRLFIQMEKGGNYLYEIVDRVHPGERSEKI